PSRKTLQWTAKSDTQNRPQRVNLTLDGATGAVLKREDFGDRKLLDRIIGTGVAAHEGQLFGWVNQALGAFTALSLIGLTLSGLVMWLKRRPAAVLGAPLALPETRVPRPMIGLAVVLGVLLPMFGLSLIAVLVIERALLRRIAPARSFLGLAPA
ncbi:MAG TPA: PepSY domain-containing protein, partial [Nevskia sp.]|nr:PepSY domain-containing protein [Nevskia sp.]